MPRRVIFTLLDFALAALAFDEYLEWRHLDWLNHHPVTTNLLSAMAGFAFATLILAEGLRRYELMTGRIADRVAVRAAERQQAQVAKQLADHNRLLAAFSTWESKHQADLEADSPLKQAWLNLVAGFEGPKHNSLSYDLWVAYCTYRGRNELTGIFSSLHDDFSIKQAHLSVAGAADPTPAKAIRSPKDSVRARSRSRCRRSGTPGPPPLARDPSMLGHCRIVPFGSEYDERPGLHRVRAVPRAQDMTADVTTVFPFSSVPTEQLKLLRNVAPNEFYASTDPVTFVKSVNLSTCTPENDAVDGDLSSARIASSHIPAGSLPAARTITPASATSSTKPATDATTILFRRVIRVFGGWNCGAGCGSGCGGGAPSGYVIGTPS